MDFASSARTAENRTRWKGIVANLSVVPRRPSKVMGLNRIELSSGCSFVKATSTLSGKALKALHSLFAITNDKEITIDFMLGLFDTFVGSILSCGCEIWGILRADNIERSFVIWGAGSVPNDHRARSKNYQVLVKTSFYQK